MKNKKISIKDVAEEAGVSPATVSRVINDTDYPVKNKTKKAVKEAVEKLNYQPNQVARNLAKKQSNIIGIIVHDISSAYFSEMLRGIEDTFFENNYIINICDTRYSVKRQLKDLNLLQANHVEAVIFPGGVIYEDDYLKDIKKCFQTLKEDGCRIIGVTSNPFDIKNVDVGNVLASRTITEYLINYGHEKIAYVNGPEIMNATSERLQGYKEALQNRDLEVVHDLIIDGDFSFKGGRQAALNLLEKKHKFSAVVAANDESALGLMWEFQQRGIEVPEEVSIVGIGNIPRSKCSYPSLTTVNLPLHEIGENIGNYIINKLDTKNYITEEYEVNVGIVERQSVKNMNM